MFLAQQGIASIAIERLRGGSPLPRAAHFHLRTLELFRLAGIEDEVKRRSEDDFQPEGAIIAIKPWWMGPNSIGPCGFALPPRYLKPGVAPPLTS